MYDCTMETDNATKFVDGLKRLSDPLLHLAGIVPRHFGDSCLALAVERSQEQLRVLPLHTLPFASAAADRPLHGEANCLAASEHGLLLVGDLFERRL